MKTQSFILAALAAAPCFPQNLEDPPTALDPIVVTATRTEQLLSEIVASITVITREDIERVQARSVQDLLAGLPGVTITNNGGAGKSTSIFLRGTESDHVLVLVDGVPLGSATLGTTAFQDLPVEQIERIELVRGPRSSLYGSQAIGGVIQIFMRQGGGPLQGSVSVGGGSDNTWNSAVAASGSSGKAVYAASLSAQDTNGFNACSAPPGAGCFTQEPDEDGYKNTGGNLHAGYRFGSDAEIDARWLRSQSENEFDGGFVNESKSTQDVAGLHLATPKIGLWRVRVDAGRSRDESENFKDGVFTTRFDTEQDSVALFNDLFLGESHRLTIGGDFRNERVSGTTIYTQNRRENTGVFAEYLGTFKRLDVQASLRSDDNEQYGGHTTGGLGLGGGLFGGLRWLAAYGTAFKAPTFNELYFPGFGNPDLNPEESKSYEAGVKGAHGWGRWSVNLFETQVDELIGFDPVTFAPVNIDRARLRGVEASLGGSFRDVDYAGHYTWQDPENRAQGANHGKVLPRRARQSFRLDLDRGLGRARLGATVRGAGRRFDDPANTPAREMGGYATVDLRAEYSIVRAWKIQLRGENLLDKNYETAKFFNQQGASGWLTVRYQFTQSGG